MMYYQCIVAANVGNRRGRCNLIFLVVQALWQKQTLSADPERFLIA